MLLYGWPEQHFVYSKQDSYDKLKVLQNKFGSGYSRKLKF